MRVCTLLGRLTLLLVLLMLAHGTRGWSAADANTITLAFAPPDAFSSIETETVTTRMTMRVPQIGMENSQVTETRRSGRVTIEKIKSGYRYTGILTSVRQTEDGERTDPEPSDLRELDVPVSYDLDRQGKLQGVRGVEGLVAKSRELTPDDVPSAAKLMTTLRSVWEAEKGALCGRTANIGATWTGNMEILFPTNDLITYAVTTKLVERTTVAGRPAVRLRYTMKTNPRTLDRVVDRLFNDDAPADESLRIRVQSETWEGERVVDLATLLDLRRRDTETLRLTATHEEAGSLEMTITTTSESSLDIAGKSRSSSKGNNVWR
jgi:hypothetical protein